jgi:hypothetical protein
MEESWFGVALSAKTYIQNVIPKVENLFGKVFKPIEKHMSEGCHSEMDDSPLCNEEDVAKYRFMICCCVWMINLGRFDISFAIFDMSRFNTLTREGHVKAAKIILSYLKTFAKGRIIVDTTYPDDSIYPIKDHPN